MERERASNQIHWDAERWQYLKMFVVAMLGMIIFALVYGISMVITMFWYLG